MFLFCFASDNHCPSLSWYYKTECSCLVEISLLLIVFKCHFIKTSLNALKITKEITSNQNTVSPGRIKWKSKSVFSLVKCQLVVMDNSLTHEGSAIWMSKRELVHSDI